MAKRRQKPGKVCVRKGSLTEELYLTRQGTWDTWEKRKRFDDDEEAERFVRRHVEGENWGIFPG
jgi:hypothetical protein